MNKSKNRKIKIGEWELEGFRLKLVIIALIFMFILGVVLGVLT